MQYHEPEFTLVDYKPRAGVNPATALAILVLAGLFSAGLFFSLAHAMLPESGAAAAREQSQPLAAPALDDSELAAALPAEDVTEAPVEAEIEGAEAEVEAEDEVDEAPNSPSPRAVQHRPSRDRERGAEQETGDEDQRPAQPQRDNIFESDDPLLGSGLGDRLDA